MDCWLVHQGYLEVIEIKAKAGMFTQDIKIGDCIKWDNKNPTRRPKFFVAIDQVTGEARVSPVPPKGNRHLAIGYGEKKPYYSIRLSYFQPLDKWVDLVLSGHTFRHRLTPVVV
jgi:hypothetical protein